VSASVKVASGEIEIHSQVSVDNFLTVTEFAFLPAILVKTATCSLGLRLVIKYQILNMTKLIFA
jgi:hypothetical protein